MCRNIKKLRRPNEKPSKEEMKDAALQFIRKVSGFRVPSKANHDAFYRAVDDVAEVTRELFQKLHGSPD